MKPGRRRCPICWQTVLPTPVRRNIAGHFDSIGRDMCPGSGIGYDLTVGGRPEPHQAWEAMTA